MMRWILIALIRLYRRVPPRFKRRRCLFRESCSLSTLRIAREEGFWPACRALRRRCAQCRPQFQVFYDAQRRHWCVYLADGTTVDATEIADFVLEPYRAALAPVLEEHRSCERERHEH